MTLNSPSFAEVHNMCFTSSFLACKVSCLAT